MLEFCVSSFLLLFVGWNIWKGINRMIYEDAKISFAQLIHAVLATIKAISLAYPFVGNKSRLHIVVRADSSMPCLSMRPANILPLTWKSPPQGWNKLNLDGAVKWDGRSLGGGIIRD
ncbi:hypothetical protein ACH5RR_026038 [Cinchona calisaya]|uniref:RNase H type-1 domain-containing protein n=1 Tax=Cinchona calisaya TaxID=153742 RepID=A0ABD2Z1D7_9GENT